MGLELGHPLCCVTGSGLGALGTRVRGRERKDPNRGCSLRGLPALPFKSNAPVSSTPRISPASVLCCRHVSAGLGSPQPFPCGCWGLLAWGRLSLGKKGRCKGA